MDYYSIAHTISESIAGQADIMVGGTLKAYQVKGTVTKINNSFGNSAISDCFFDLFFFSIFGNLD